LQTNDAKATCVIDILEPVMLRRRVRSVEDSVQHDKCINNFVYRTIDREVRFRYVLKLRMHTDYKEKLNDTPYAQKEMSSKSRALRFFNLKCGHWTLMRYSSQSAN
jgi:hypothetical protein